MPQIYVTGTLVAASGFRDGSLFCRWGVHYDLSCWRLVAGEHTGQTQSADTDAEGVALWDHPLDMHFSATDAAGWPSLALEVWRHEPWTGRNEQVGVALFRVPSAPGEHVREVGAWRPRGTAWESLVASVGGPVPSLRSTDTAFTVNADRSELTTVTAGTVVVECRVAVREMAGSGLVLRPMTAVENSLVAAVVSGGYAAARKGQVFSGDSESSEEESGAGPLPTE